MKFFKGRVNFLRFAVCGTPPQSFGDEHLDKLREHAAGRQTLATADRIETGWVASKSVLDTAFDREKNILNDTLHFALRVDTDRVPAALRRAYYEAELAALLKDDPRGFPSARQKRDAKESAANRLRMEADDGRFRRRKCTAVLWDRAANEILLGATTRSLVNHFSELFTQTFGFPLELLPSGRKARQGAASPKLSAYADPPVSFAPRADGEDSDFVIDLGTDTAPTDHFSRVTPVPDRRGLPLDCLRRVPRSGTLVSEGTGRPTERPRTPQRESGPESPEPPPQDDADFTLSNADTYESDCEIPRMDDLSGSESLAVETDPGLEEVVDQDRDADANPVPGSCELLLIDDLEEPDGAEDQSHENPADVEDVVDLAEMQEEEYAPIPLGVSETETDAGEVEAEASARAEVDRPIPWGTVPTLLLIPSLILALMGGLMGVELLQTMWGYQQPRRPAALLVRSVAHLLDMELRDR